MTSNTSESELLEQVLPSASDSQSDSLLLSSETKSAKEVFNHLNLTGLKAETSLAEPGEASARLRPHKVSYRIKSYCLPATQRKV